MTARLEVRVQPGARTDGLVGWMSNGALKLRVRAAPEAGQANRAVEELVAGVLGVKTAAVTVTRGQSSRAKTVDVEGLDQEEVRARIQAALDEAGRHGAKNG